jgi:hypothetical protein
MRNPSTRWLILLGTSLALTPIATLALDTGPSGPAVARAAKAAPLAPTRAAPRQTAATVEVVGLDGAVVILRSRDGAVLYRADATAGTTLVVRNADLPTVTLRQREGETVTSQDPTAPPAQPASSPANAPPAALPPPVTGCEGAVSALANRTLARKPSLCLADASHPSRG